jgi:hypothetical protein
MKRKQFRAIRAALALALVSGALAIAADSARADGLERVSDRNQLFYNFYVGPGGANIGVPAQLYPSPIATPPIVGHTYITYPALMPHEFLYHHSRHYYRHNPGGGWTHTTVRYH